METTESHLHLVRFIHEYRSMEKQPYSYGYEIINNFAEHDSMARHLHNHWYGKKKDFGSFYLNLSSRSQIKLINWFGISDPKDRSFLDRIDKEGELVMFFEKPEGFVSTVNKMMVYFNNHSLADYGIVPEKRLPAFAKQYGNSTNWGNLILKCTDDEVDAILSKILNLEHA